jgi:hypothetical protein
MKENLADQLVKANRLIRSQRQRIDYLIDKMEKQDAEHTETIQRKDENIEEIEERFDEASSYFRKEKEEFYKTETFLTKEYSDALGKITSVTKERNTYRRYFHMMWWMIVVTSLLVYLANSYGRE